MTARRWSDQEMMQLRKMAEQFSSHEIAKNLNRSEEAIRVQSWKFGISLKLKTVAIAPSLDPMVNKEQGRIVPEPVELDVAAAAIERALTVYEQLQPRDLP
jgi:hypothetical protein